MVVPNYIPDPIEIPGNVTLQPYRVRLRFIRRMQALQIASIFIVAGLANLNQVPLIPLWPALITLLAWLIALCLVRIGLRSTRSEVVFSSVLIPILLALVTLAARSVIHAGAPLWAVVFGPVFAYVYSLFCGRDFSFVGQFVLSLIASTVAVAAVILVMGHQGLYALEAIGLNAAFLTYFVYDGASLLSRRRVGEEIAAVTDLYRDVLNIFGYVPRVVHHWHKHRIWQLR
jgi:hypothetical protein